jgi:hypothetical protein
MQAEEIFHPFLLIIIDKLNRKMLRWYLFLGVIIFFPHELPKNAQCPHELPTWPKYSIQLPKTTIFFPFRQLEGLKEAVSGSCAVLHRGMLEDGGSLWREKRKMVIVHGGKRGRKWG